MFEIGGKKYSVDIDKLLEYLNGKEKKYERKTKELLDVYDFEQKSTGKQTSKTLRELIEPSDFDTNSISFNIVYAFRCDSHCFV